MSEEQTEALREEIEHYCSEKERIRNLIGQIGGKASARRDRYVNAVFVLALAVLVTLDILRHTVHLPVPLPPLFSLELGIFLVSIKIVWMIHRQTKVEHFQFWMLNSIEFRLNDLARQLRELEERLKV